MVARGKGSVGVAAVIVAVILTAGGMVATDSAHACSCARPGSPAEALADADAVFAGKVIAIRPTGHPPFRLSSADPVEVEFKITRVWKGPRLRTALIKTARSEVSCGFEFSKGQHYIVYANSGRTGLCSRTAPAWRAFEDMVALGMGSRPDAEPTDGTRVGGSCGVAVSRQQAPMDVATLALLAGVIALGIRRRPRL